MDYTLSAAQINEYRETGYLVVNKLFTSAELDVISAYEDEVFLEAIDAVICKVKNENIQPGTRFSIEFAGSDGEHSAIVTAVYNSDRSYSVSHVSWIGGVRPELLSLGRLSKVTIPVAQILRSRKGDHLINQAHFKMPNDNVSFPWHQDIDNRRSFDPNWKDVNGNGSFVQVITAVEESCSGNGGLIIVPNSHHLHLGLMDVKTNLEKEEIVRRRYSDEKFLHLSLHPGDTLFMHPLIVHKSDVNTSGLSRKTFINGFSSPGANTRPYPGKGSAVCVDLNVSADMNL